MEMSYVRDFYSKPIMSPIQLIADRTVYPMMEENGNTEEPFDQINRFS